MDWLQRSLFDFFAIVLKQKYERHKFLCAWLLAKIYIFMCLVMNVYYQSIMNAQLTAPSRTKMPFLNQQQLVGRFYAERINLLSNY